MPEHPAPDSLGQQQQHTNNTFLQSHPIDLGELLTSVSRSARTFTPPSKLVKLQWRLRHCQRLLKKKLPPALAAKTSALKQVKLLEAQLAAKDVELMALKRELVQVLDNSQLLSSWLDSSNMQLQVGGGCGSHNMWSDGLHDDVIWLSHNSRH